MPKNIPKDDIIYNRTIYRYGGSADKPTIRNYTTDKGWAGGKSGMPKDEVESLWKFMVENQDTSRVIEKRGCDLVIVPANKNAVATVAPPESSPVNISNPHSVRFSEKLDQAAHLINHRYEILKKPANAQGRAVVEIGIIMLAVKDNLPHGELAKWRDENTRLSERWDIYCRKAAQKFIAEHGQGTAAALIEGSGSNKRQVEQAEQLLMQFTGGKGPSALLHNLGIKKAEKAPPAELPPGESGEHYNAVKTWNHIGGLLNDHGLTKESWAYLNPEEMTPLYDMIHELDKRLKAVLKK